MHEVSESLRRVYTSIGELIRFADGKASVVLAVNGIIIGAFFSNLGSIERLLGSNPLIFGLLALSALAEGLSIFFALRCLNPIPRVGPPNSLLYFLDIADNYAHAADYAQAAEQTFADDRALASEITQQIWAVSHIARRKFIAVGWATRFLGVTIALAALIILIALTVAFQASDWWL